MGEEQKKEDYPKITVRLLTIGCEIVQWKSPFVYETIIIPNTVVAYICTQYLAAQGGTHV